MYLEREDDNTFPSYKPLQGAVEMEESVGLGFGRKRRVTVVPLIDRLVRKNSQ
jgi:hypothetical protein